MDHDSINDQLAANLTQRLNAVYLPSIQPTDQPKMTCELCAGNLFDLVPDSMPKLFACRACRIVVYPKPSPAIGRVAKGAPPDLSTAHGGRKDS